MSEPLESINKPSAPVDQDRQRIVGKMLEEFASPKNIDQGQRNSSAKMLEQGFLNFGFLSSNKDSSYTNSSFEKESMKYEKPQSLNDWLDSLRKPPHSSLENKLEMKPLPQHQHGNNHKLLENGGSQLPRNFQNDDSSTPRPFEVKPIPMLETPLFMPPIPFRR